MSSGLGSASGAIAVSNWRLLCITACVQALVCTPALLPSVHGASQEYESRRRAWPKLRVIQQSCNGLRMKAYSNTWSHTCMHRSSDFSGVLEGRGPREKWQTSRASDGCSHDPNAMPRDCEGHVLQSLWSDSSADRCVPFSVVRCWFHFPRAFCKRLL